MKMNFCFDLNGAEVSKWNDFWQHCHHSHARQNYLFGEIERAKGRTPVYIYGEVSGSIVCAGIFSLRPLFKAKYFSFEAICTRGPAFDDVAHGEFYMRETVSWFSSLRVGKVRISPYWYFPEAEPVALLLGRLEFVPYDGEHRTSTGLLDLTRSEEEIFASFDRKTRQQIKAATKLGVSIVPVTDFAEANLAFNCLRSMREQRGIKPMSEKEFAAVFEYILKGQDIGFLFNARLGSTFLGALWNFRTQDFTNPSGYAIAPGASKDLPSSYSIGPALWWEMQKWAKAKGCRWFDVEGYIENPDPSIKTYAVHKFKKRFNPQAVELINEHVKVCNKTIDFLSQQYSRLVLLLRVMVSLPYRVRQYFRSRERSKLIGNKDT